MCGTSTATEVVTIPTPEQILASGWPQRNAESVRTIPELVDLAVRSEFLPGGHFKKIADVTSRICIDNETLCANRAQIVSLTLRGLDVCLRGQLLVQHYLGRQSRTRYAEVLDELALTGSRDLRLDLYQNPDSGKLVLCWR